MSSGGQILGAVGGGIVGFVFSGGNPVVAAKSAAYGAAIGAALDPPPGPDLEGPRISDSTEQTSSYGAPIATINGKTATSGTVIWVENNKKKIVAKKEDSGGGKGGGGGSETTTYEAFVTCAILLSDHLVDGMGRLWIGGKLVSNGLSDDLATAAASGELFPTLSLHTDSGLLKASLSSNPESGTVRLYPGFDDQPVDPRMEADLGAGSCPAYRGYAVLYLYDYPLKDVSNSIAGLQVKAELIKGGAITAPTLLSTLSRAHPLSPTISGTGEYAQCAYLNTEEAVVYAPLLDFPTMQIARVEFSNSGAIVTGKGTYTTTNNNGQGQGWSDVDGGPYHNYPLSAFPALRTSGAGGRLLVKNEHTYGHSPTHLYSLSHELLAVGYSAVPSNLPLAITADDSGNLYSITTAGIERYDKELNLLDSKPIVFTGVHVSYGIQTTIAVWDSGASQLYVGFTAGNDVYMNFHAVDYEEETIGDLITLGDAPSVTGNNSNINIQGGILTRFYYVSDEVEDDYTIYIERWRLPTVDGSGQPLAAVVREKMEKAELIEPADIDVSLLTGDVTGYKTSGISSIRSTISPLMAGYNFDVIESGYTLKCVPRGQSPVMTIDYNDLDARPFGSAPGVAIDQQREMDSQLPRQMLLNYIDAGRNYNQNQAQSIERLSSKAINKESYELALVFTPTEGEAQASAQMDRRWLERDDFAFTLPQTYNRIEPADVVDLPTPYADYELRLSSINYLADGRLECTAKLNDSATYVQNATGGTRVLGDTTVTYAGASIMHLLDIPLIRDEDNKAGFAGALTGKSTGWPGGKIIRSIDSGQTYQAIQGFASHVTSGVCRDSLPTHDGYTIDRTNTLTLDLYNSGLTLSSITQEQMLTGKNWFACGVAGRWELCQYANATLNADGSYTLDTLVRGAKGTEQYTGTHQDGDLFVFLADADAAFIAANVSDIGVERLYRGVTTGKDIDTVADTAFIYLGVNLEPLSPVQLAGSIDGSDNWDLTWLRRSRLSSSWWTTGVVAPVGEDTESYEIDIMNGSTVVRTLTSTSEAVEYSSADQVIDFGSNQTTLKFRVYQMSATVGRGYVAEITL